jgi:hypothetical protein
MSKRSKAGGASSPPAAVLAALPRRIGGLFDLMAVAEEEIDAASKRHPGRERMLSAAFGLLCPPAGMSKLDPKLYRAHARELCERVAAFDGPPENHRPLALGTKAEVLMVLSELSLKAPPSQQYAALYELLFAEIFGAAAVPAGEPVREPWPKASTELLGTMQRRLGKARPI